MAHDRGDQRKARGFNVPSVIEPFGAFSCAAWQPPGWVLHVSGHVCKDVNGETVGKGNMEAQTRKALESIRDVLAYAGGTMDDIAKVTLFGTDVSELMTIHDVRGEFFKPPYPASSLVQVARLIDPDWLIEIEAVVVIPEDRATVQAPPD
ncbi:MAG: enamine deaminase RidA [Gemmatimonadetes bacterium]|nr:enamine deaminase RidA [Gemmatimonadota bacterium]|tara:strand:+ start:425 stop:874 length:450 start_codon:yes stop_codon:yes gene_type:complete